MQRELITAMFGHILLKIPLFEVLQAEDGAFLEDMWPHFQYSTFPPDRIVVELGEAADRLIVLVRGEMCVYSMDESQMTTDTRTRTRTLVCFSFRIITLLFAGMPENRQPWLYLSLACHPDKSRRLSG